MFAAARQVEFVPIVRAPQRLDKLPSKDPTQDLHRQEEARVLRMDPALVIRRESPCRHDAMHVRMTDQRLAPRVQDGQHSDLRAEMPRIGRDLAQGRSAGLKQPRVQTGAVPIGQRQERMRERENDMHIGHIEQIALPRAQPALASLRLALRAVP